MNRNSLRLALAAVTLSATPVLITPAVFAQAISVNGGSIQGTITDPSGAAVSGASISILNPSTGFKKDLTADKDGFYSVGPLNPGDYTVTVSSAGFQGLSVKTVIRTGTATPGNFKLHVGQSTTEISVTAGDVQVNTEQPGVSGVITQQQIDSLPINGRSFLDLAQLEPGVQLQNGNSFDPTKAGYSALAVNGVSGRTTRILLDGQDITDENVGTTIFNVAQGAIGEFQINHSTQDVSGELTSTGQVLVSTRSGTNQMHGNLFYNFQDNNVGFATFDHNNPPFQRNQFGGGVGGPIIKDKLFFFGDIERLKQDQSTGSTVSSTLFSNLKSEFPSISTPYRSTYSTIRLDANGPLGGHYFVRGNYDVNSDPSGTNYSLYVNRDNTWGIAGGADFSTGKFTHSFRGSYEKFHNLIGDFTAGNSSVYNPFPGAQIDFPAASLETGPNANAPQQTYQSDKQIRYDGSWTKGKHNLRYGGSFNSMLGGGLASFFGLAPRIYLSSAFQTGDPTNINTYSPYQFYVGNGQGYFSEKPGFGLPAGGQSDNRMALYLTDAWKVTPSFTFSAGIRYSRDTLRANQDVPQIPCSAVDTANFGGYTPCTSGNLLDQFGAGLGAKVNQPNLNFGPQIGFTWAPGGSSKTVLRGGYGIYYDSNIWNNILFDRENRLATGLFNSYSLIHLNTSNPQVVFPGGVVHTTTPDGTPLTALTSEPLNVATPKIIALQQAYQTAVAAVGAANPNPGYVGQTLAIQSAFYSPNYVSPYSQQMNFGIQREITNGAVLSVDYVHSVTLKIQQSIDENHVGAARYLNAAAATNAIAATAAQFKCGGATAQAQVACSIAAGAQLSDFEGNGLDSGNNYLGGNSAYYDGKTPGTGAAFAGANPALGNGLFNTPSGKAAYDALEVKLQQQKSHPMPGVLSSNFQFAYTYSHTTGTSRGGSNTFFTDGAWDYDAPSQYMGPTDLDQRHQFSFGGSANLKYGPTIALIGHFRSAAASNLTLDNTATTDIFQTDVDGDGQTGDLAPGTNPGAFMRSIKPNQLKNYIAGYNANQAGTLTPAGKALVSSGYFTQGQLSAINAVQQPIYSPSLPVFPNAWFRSIDASVSYPIHVRKISEAFAITPGVAMYNVANFSNRDTLADANSTALLSTANAGANGTSSASYINGENPYLATKDQYRTQRGSGTFDQGGLRSTEFQLKVVF